MSTQKRASCIQMFLSSAILLIRNQMKNLFRLGMYILCRLEVFVLTSSDILPDSDSGHKMYDTRDTPHHALQTKYPLHDSKPGVVSTAELINPSTEIKEERERKKERQKKTGVSCYSFLKYTITTACEGAVLIDYCVCGNYLHSLNSFAMVDQPLVRNYRNV